MNKTPEEYERKCPTGECKRRGIIICPKCVEFDVVVNNENNKRMAKAIMEEE